MLKTLFLPPFYDGSYIDSEYTTSFLLPNQVKASRRGNGTENQRRTQGALERKEGGNIRLAHQKNIMIVRIF